MLSWDEFEKVDMRAGTIIRAQPFPEARKPAYQVWIDFGPELGIKRSSAQITAFYKPHDLIGRQIIAVVNFPPKQIGPFMSECLLLGVYGNTGEVTLLHPGLPVENGGKVG